MWKLYTDRGISHAHCVRFEMTEGGGVRFEMTEMGLRSVNGECSIATQRHFEGEKRLRNLTKGGLVLWFVGFLTLTALGSK
jgi:hypothetical protein